MGGDPTSCAPDVELMGLQTTFHRSFSKNIVIVLVKSIFLNSRQFDPDGHEIFLSCLQCFCQIGL